MIVTVTPNPSLDLTYQLPAGLGTHLTPGADHVHRAVAATLEASGKGVNVSRVLAAAGYETTAVVATGGGTGDQLLSLLAAQGISYRNVTQAGPTRINATILAGGGVTKVNGPGCRPVPAELDALVSATEQAIAQAAARAGAARGGESGGREVWLAVCGSLPPQTDPGLVTRLVKAGHSAGARCAADTTGPALVEALAAGADLLAPNLAELAGLCPPLGAVAQLPGGPERDQAVRGEAVREQVTSLASRHGCELLVSCGAAGAIWTDGHTCLHAPAQQVTPVNTAGAGDALLAGWLSGSSLQPADRLARAVRWGTAAVLAATTVAGPAP